MVIKNIGRYLELYKGVVRFKLQHQHFRGANKGLAGPSTLQVPLELNTFLI